MATLSATQTSPLVSVVTPTFNGLHRLPTLIAALERQTLPRHLFEVIVVDDGSTDGTADWIEQQASIRLVRSPGNVGQGAATNLGVNTAQARVIAMTDDDTVPAESWLENGLAHFEHARAVFLGGRIALDLGTDPSPTAMLDYGMGYLDQEKHLQGGFAATANFWARRGTFLDLGGFNEELLAQCHDVEFGHRVRVAGFAIDYAADTVVAHPARGEILSFARKQFRIGVSASELRSHGVPPFSEGRPLWAQPGWYRPWMSIWGLDRIRALGFEPAGLRLLRMWLVQYIALQLPLALGNLKASVSRLLSS